MKRRLHSVYTLFWVVLLGTFFYSNFNSPPNGNTGAPPFGSTCANCHSGGTGTGNVVIAGLPATISPSTLYPITVTVNRTNAVPLLGGFQMVTLNAGSNNTSFGTLSSPGTSSALDPTGSLIYFEHAPAQSFGGNDFVTYTVNWMSPATGSGDVTMYAAANLANDNNSTTGDAIVTTTSVGVFMGGGGGAISVSVSGTNVACFGASTGSATATPTGGGGGPYTYAWSNGGTTQTINNLAAGTYMVTVSNATGTPGTGSVTITQPAAPLVVSIVNQTNINCLTPIGSAMAQGSGGTGSINYNWSSGASGQTVNLAAGTFTVTVTDGNNCTSTTSVTITSNTTPPTAEAGATVALNCVSPTATLNGAGSSTGGSFSYLWTTSNGQILSGATTLTPTVGAAGNYVLTVTNSTNFCTASDNVTVTSSINPPIANAGADVSLTCISPSVQLNGTGSSTGANFTCSWSGPGISSGGNTHTPTVTAAGTYTLTVLNLTNGCTATDQVVVTSNITLPTTTAGADLALSCTNTTVTLNGTGTSTGANFSYLWVASNGGNIVSGATTLMPVANAAGTYCLTTTNTANGCTSTDCAVVTSNTTAPTAAAGADLVLTCTTTSLQLNGSSSSSGANITYLWTTANGHIVSGANTATPTVDEPGAYCLLVTNTFNGCTASDCATVTENVSVPGINIPVPPALTCTTTSLMLQASVAPAGNYTYLWTTNNGQITAGVTTLTPTITAAGIYTLTVTNLANGCTAIAAVTATSNTTPPIANAGPNFALNCSNSVVVLNGSGSSQGGSISYLWSGPGIQSGGTTTNPTVNAAGTYTLVVSNSDNGCIATDAAVVTQTPTLQASIPAQLNVACNGNNTGSATAQGTGGMGSYAYAWSNSATTQQVSNLAAGTYSVTLTDADNCTASATVIITQPPVLLANASATGETLPGAANGTASVAPSGGAGNYAFVWSTGANTTTIIGLAAGNYSVTVTDANGCAATETVTVSSFNCAGLAVSFTSLNPSCNGGSNGSATALPAGGMSPYEFDWSNGSTNPTASNLGAGTYTVSITDANTCVVTGNVTLSEPPSLTLGVLQQSNVSCNGGSNGSASVAAAGGTPGYTYAWSNGGTGASQNNLSAGNYSVTATDTKNCQTTTQVTIMEPSALAGNVNATGETAVGANNGTAAATISGGTTPYSYAWNTGATTSSITGLSPGTYCVTATDANGCAFTGCATVAQFGCGGTNAVIGGQNVNCFGGNDGAANVIASGFNEPITYEWSNDATGANVNNLVAGTYTVSVTDASGCTAVESIEITEPPLLSVVLLNVENTTCGQSNGAISVNGNGGTPGYTFLWSNNSLNPTILSLPADIYTVSLTDAHNCEATLDVNVINMPDIEPPAVLVQNISLALGANGQASVSVQQLDGGSSDNCGIAQTQIDVTDFDCDDIGENPVLFTVTDLSGNAITDTAFVTILDDTPPVLTCPDNVVSTSDCISTVEYTSPAGSDNCPGLDVYLFTGLPSGAIFPTGETEVTWGADDHHGNTVFCTFTVTVNSNFSAATTFTEPDCNGFEDATATVTPSGGLAPYGYEWNDPANQMTQTATGLAAGMYVVFVTDAEDCITSAIVEITEPEAILVTIDEIINPGDVNDGAISVTVTGGTGDDLEIEWSYNGAFFSNEEDLTNLAAGEYVIQVTDDTDCTVLDTIHLSPIGATLDADLQCRITVLPNPTSGKLHLQFDLPQGAEVSASLFDLHGKKAMPVVRQFIAGQRLEMNLPQALGTGVYILKIMVGEKIAVKRVVLSR